jgi:hypothetical protein
LAIGPFFLKNGAESALYYTFMMKTKKGSMSHFIENKKKKLKVRQNTTDRTTMDVKEPAYKNLHSKPVLSPDGQDCYRHGATSTKMLVE